MEGEMKERRKIQFSVPSAVPTQLDPKQVEMIRRRRPTPATLFRMTDHPSPEEENPGHQLAVCDNGLLMGKRVNTSIYQPPSLTAVQKMVEAHMQSETGQDSPSSETSDNEEAFPDSDRDDSRSDELEHHPGHEDTAEEQDSTLRHAPGEDNEGELQEGFHRKAETRDNGDIQKTAQAETPSLKLESNYLCTESPENTELPPNPVTDLPDDTRSDQSEDQDHSAPEVTDKGTVPTLLYDAPCEGGSAETEDEEERVGKSAESPDKRKSMEKGED
ncbi:protein phosphatase 1 regulatory subunit 1B [Astyanax mexicanus]|uniref:protein phosphatase 1 regulatory subunit 1B n=1 Tax=Astyanax mexicanus TaxID=7994 RepID=UPI0020CB3A71|nr:protein phosphatase 1 regulatory subunit 1B [Astyanax mexicanus]